jgi:molecular chaperone GrpE
MSKAKKHAAEAQAAPADTTQGEAAAVNGTAEAWTEEVPAPDASEELRRLRDALGLAEERLLRLRAEFDNHRRRTAQDMSRLREQAVDRVVLALLPALDDLERVSRQPAGADGEALLRGLELVLAKFQTQLGQVEVTAFESRGQMFDPALHEALTTGSESSRPEDEVLDELVRGYRRGTAVIRHAQVVVNKP